MVRLVAEVAPAAPGLAGLTGLVALAALLVALGLVILTERFCRALFGRAAGLIAHVPWLGTTIANGLTSVEQRLTHYLGGAAEALQGYIGVVWHATARTVEYLGHQVLAQSVALYNLAASLPADLSKLITQTIPKAITNTVKVVEHTTTTVVQRVVKVEKVVTHTVTHTATAAAKAVAIPADQVINGTIDELRDRVKALEDGAVDLYRKARGVITVPAVAAAGAVVAVALTALGLNWIRCNNWKKVGRSGCRLDTSLLDALLTDTLAIVGVLSVVEFANELRAVEDEALKILGGLVREWPGS